MTGGALVDTNNRQLKIGYEPGVTGTVTVTGPGSRLLAGDPHLAVGWQGTGFLTVADGGFVSAGGVAVGMDHPTGVGTLTITGAGSRFNSYGSDGRNGTGGGHGTIIIEQGGAFTHGVFMHGGSGAGSVGHFIVRDPGSSLTTRFLHLGDGGIGTMAVSNGAVVTITENMDLSRSATSTSSCTVSGTGSAINITNGLYTSAGHGSLSITDGGVLTAREINSWGAGTTVEYAVSGPGSELSQTGNGVFVVGLDGATATLTVSDGGLVTAREVCIGCGRFSDGLVVVQNGGALETRHERIGIGGSAGHPARLIVDGADSYVFAQGRIDVGGDAAMQLHSIVTLRNAGRLITADYMPMGTGGVLEGEGEVEGHVANWAGAVRPGLEAGTLHIGPHGYSQHANGALETEIGGPAPGTEHDVLEVVGSVWLAGELRIALINGFVPAIGDSFDVVTYTGQRHGSFDRLVGADIAPGRALVATYPSNAVRLIVDGVLGLTITPPSQTVYLGFTEPLTATAQMSVSGPVDVTASATWSSDDPNIATVSADGRVTGVAAGVTVIRGLFAGFEASAAVTVLPLPTQPDTAPGLVADYFELWRPDFEHLTPVATEMRTTIDVPCPPYGQPFGGSGLLADYGAIFTGELIIPADDEYTLDFWVDWGGARLVVDGVPIAAKDWWAGPVRATVFLSAGPHDVLCELYKYGTYGCTYAILSWESDTIPKQVVPADAWAAPGVFTRYYSITPPTLPTDVPDYTDWVVFYSAVVPALNFPYNFAPSFMGPFSHDTGVRFSGYLAIPAAGDYTFYMHVDEGAKLFVDDALVAYSNAQGFWYEASGTVSLMAGLHAIRVDAYERGYFHGLVVEMEGPGISRQPIPASAFSHGPPLTGACCFRNGTCEIKSEVDCLATGGTWQGAGTACDPNPCGVVLCPGDLNCDGAVDFDDIDLLVEALNYPGGAGWPHACAWSNGDCTGDGAVDFDDIDAFVARIGTSCP